ncbi:DUF2075 domain-containing protein [Micromonospora sp. NBC_01796]|uniref:DUF2075 domain-containing protein n=1 Tax=Micromonospora sp. NBC_01796 TaxID=2975987 RepID=UPI002DDA8509|nr:DUF2075 domain-containing protein [Micromonospora sp. NBC_01796]WSA87802.1 DUF2075 domain-containing protein [Micromonospora sp. NBC_01796]
MGSRCLLRRTVAEILATDSNVFIAELEQAFRLQIGKSPTSSEVNSWRRSIPTITQALAAEGLHQVAVLIELRGPLTNTRMDLVLVGSHPSDGRSSVVVVENKQWSKTDAVPASELVRVPGLPDQVHPANQVWAYCNTLTNYLPALENAHVYGMVNMHNASSGDLYRIQPAAMGLDPEVCRNVRIFGDDQRDDLGRFFRAVLSATDAASHADYLIKSPVRPTRALMTAVSDAVLRRSVFTLLDDQRLAYDHVLRAVHESHANNHKEIILVVGGPGTGKSVIAIELLGALSRLNTSTVHATGSKSFTNTLRDQLGTSNRRAKQVFTYFNNYAHVKQNGIDVLIADEAHRIRLSSNHRFTPRDRRSTIAQVEELINAARVPVFLLDENQIVRKGEMGSVESIRQAAANLGIQVTEVHLRDQFRCGGCQEYVDWVEELLGLTGNGPRVWEPLDTFDLRLADTPEAMERYLRQKLDQGLQSRIAAGYCWSWSDARPDGSLVDDVVIGDWKRPWNSRADRMINGIPAADLWATHEGGFHQVGCVYTAQGLEYDHAGVILGPDLVWRDGAWVADSKASYDSKVKGAVNFDQLVRNTYKVLATRGSRGAVLYSVDPETRAMLAGLGIPKI